MPNKYVGVKMHGESTDKERAKVGSKTPGSADFKPATAKTVAGKNFGNTKNASTQTFMK